MKINDLALQRSKYKHLSDDEWRWFLQQVEGRERTADKLPLFASIEDWWYPVRLSCEQCSSELTARYKASLCQRSGLSAERSVLCQSAGRSLLDLTGGYGVDTYFLSELFDHTDYVEQNAELCRIATHNFADKPIAIHNCTAEEFLTNHQSTNPSIHQYSLIFLDPARRDSHGGKVFRLEDCTPNVLELLPTLLSHLSPDGHILLKLSPMLDLTQAVKELSSIHRTSSLCPLSWDIHVVAVKNEVKEVLLCTKGQCAKYEGKITSIDLAEPEKAFTFTKEEECGSSSLPLKGKLEGAYLYEPNAAILKAGAYKLIAERFNLHKLDINTHLYVSGTLVENFPGRIFEAQLYKGGMEAGSQANVLVRNYPLTAEQLKKKLRLKDGGSTYVIGCRVNSKPTIFIAKRVN